MKNSNLAFGIEARQSMAPSRSQKNEYRHLYRLVGYLDGIRAPGFVYPIFVRDGKYYHCEANDFDIVEIFLEIDEGTSWKEINFLHTTTDNIPKFVFVGSPSIHVIYISDDELIVSYRCAALDYLNNPYYNKHYDLWIELAIFAGEDEKAILHTIELATENSQNFHLDLIAEQYAIIQSYDWYKPASWNLRRLHSIATESYILSCNLADLPIDIRNLAIFVIENVTKFWSQFGSEDIEDSGLTTRKAFGSINAIDKKIASLSLTHELTGFLNHLRNLSIVIYVIGLTSNLYKTNLPLIKTRSENSLYDVLISDAFKVSLTTIIDSAPSERLAAIVQLISKIDYGEIDEIRPGFIGAGQILKINKDASLEILAYGEVFVVEKNLISPADTISTPAVGNVRIFAKLRTGNFITMRGPEFASSAFDIFTLESTDQEKAAHDIIGGANSHFIHVTSEAKASRLLLGAKTNHNIEQLTSILGLRRISIVSRNRSNDSDACSIIKNFINNIYSSAQIEPGTLPDTLTQNDDAVIKITIHYDSFGKIDVLSFAKKVRTFEAVLLKLFKSLSLQCRFLILISRGESKVAIEWNDFKAQQKLFRDEGAIEADGHWDPSVYYLVQPMSRNLRRPKR